MAQLSSPGISVTVVDESFYTPAAPGTVPLIIVASQANKMNSAGTGTAPGTLAANAGKVYLLTSQADLGATFGIPYFQTDAENNPVNAGELNEYGLQAAYSFLGVSNRAYVVRADLDTSQLEGQAAAPTSAPADGTLWLDIADTQFGIFQWNGSAATTSGGQLFQNQGSINNLSYITSSSLQTNDGLYAPLASFGSLGDYALTGATGSNQLIKLWFKKYQTDTAAGTWVEVGSSAWKKSWPTVTATAAPSSISSSDTLIINSTTVTGATTISALATAINTAAISGITAAVVNNYLQIYSDGTCTYQSYAAGSITLGGTLVAATVATSTLGLIGTQSATGGHYLCPQFTISPHYNVPLYGTYDQASYTNGAPTGSVWIKATPVNLGANWFIKKYNAATSTWIQQPVQLFANGHSALASLDPQGAGLAAGVSYVKYNDSEATNPLGRFSVYTRSGVGGTSITSKVISNGTLDTNPLTAVGTGYIGGAIASATGIISNGSGSSAGLVFTPTGAITGTFAVGMHITGTGTTASTITTLNSATFTSTIATTTMTVSAISNGSITPGMVLSGGSVTAGSYVTTQLTATNTAAATTTATASSGVSTITVASGASIVAGQLVTAAGIPNGTFVGSSYVTASTSVPLVNAYGVAVNTTAPLSTTAINFYTAGLQGTYTLSQSSTGTPTTGTSFSVSLSQLVSSTTITGTANGSTLNITSLTSGSFAVGMTVTGIAGVTAGTTITALGSGSGGTGSYTVSTSQYVPSTTITGTAGSETYTFSMSWSQTGSTTLASANNITFNATGVALADANAFLAAVQAAVSDSNIQATITGTTLQPTVTITHLTGGDMRFTDGTNTPLATLFPVATTANLYTAPNGTTGQFIATQWQSLASSAPVAPASLTAPTTTPADGTLWYNTDITDVDIMINDGTQWRGYYTTAAKTINTAVYPAASPLYTDPNGPIVSATQPLRQSSASVNSGGALANGDIWVSTANLENFPLIYKYNAVTTKWVLLNNADQETSNGILFADARWSDDSANSATAKTGAASPQAIAGSTTGTLITSDFVDFDAPDPALYPKGMLLWNLRRSGFNVKKYHKNYVNTQALNPRQGNGVMSYYYPDRWVSEAPNNLDGSGAFGRKAQRAVVLKALNATIQSNQNIRQPDTVIYNLLSCPGYLEVTSELIGLNTDNGQTAFIVADSPARLTPDATTLSNWGNNSAGAAVDGETGLIATDPYTAVYYPWGYTTDLMGNNIVVPPSHIMLRTIALSDNVSYPWFAPAGVRRGGVTNASSVGYVDAQSGEFHTVALNIGQRDTLAAVHVNPITYIAGTGLVAYGQKTRQLIASSLDRINVARLVIYLRYQLNQLAKPFVFEPNDTITRNEIKQQVEKLLLELTAQRALYDYLVVCDTSNNTPARIDRNELYVDIAIEPVKAVEFIYIPVRLENTGAIKGLGK